MLPYLGNLQKRGKEYPRDFFPLIFKKFLMSLKKNKEILIFSLELMKKIMGGNLESSDFIFHENACM